jgi:hypothetical protein
MKDNIIIGKQQAVWPINKFKGGEKNSYVAKINIGH